MQRIFNCDKIQDNSLTPDKALNSLTDLGIPSSSTIMLNTKTIFVSRPGSYHNKSVKAGKSLISM